MYVCCVHFPGVRGVKYLSTSGFTGKLSEAWILNDSEVRGLKEDYDFKGFDSFVRIVWGLDAQVEFRQVFERKVLSLIDPNAPRRKGRERKWEREQYSGIATEV